MAVGFASIKLTLDDSAVLSGLKSISKTIDGLENKKLKLDVDSSSLKKASDSISKITGAKIPTPNIDIAPIGNSLNRLQAQLSIAQERYQNLFSKQTPPNTAQIKSAELSIANLKQRIIDVKGSQSGDILANLKSSLQNGVSVIGNAGSTIVSVLKSIATAGLALGAVGLGSFALGAKGALEYAGGLQQARADLTILLDGQENSLKVVKDLSKFASQTPLDTETLIQSAKVLGTSVKNTDELILRTKQLGEATGGSAEGLRRVSNTYSQVVGKGKVDTIDLKEFVNAGFVNIKTEAQKELGLTGQAFEDAISQGLLTTEVLNKVLDRSTSGFARLNAASKTLPGLMSSASDSFKNFGLRIIGVNENLEFTKGGIADLASSVLLQFNSPAVQTSLDRLGTSIGNLFSKIFNIDINDQAGTGIAGIIDSISVAIDGLPAKVQTFIDGFNSITNSPVVEFIKGLFNGEQQPSIFDGISAKINEIANNPIIKPFLDQLIATFERFKPTLDLIVGAIGSVINVIVSLINNPAVQLIIGGAIAIAFEAIILVINNVINVINLLAGAATIGFSAIKTIIDNLSDTIRTVGDIVVKVFKGDFQGAFDSAIGFAERFKSRIIGLFDSIKKTIQDTLNSIKIPEIKLPFSTGGEVPQYRNLGGPIYADKGKFISRGTDTVPAMLTPGEFVVNREATKNNRGLLSLINSSKANFLEGLNSKLGTLLSPSVFARSVGENSVSNSKTVNINVNYNGSNVQNDSRFLFNLQNLANTSML